MRFYMKILDRLGLALFSMLVLTISIVLLLIGFGFVDASMFSILIEKVLESQQSTYIMEGICVGLSLLSLKCLFFGQDSLGKSEEGVLMQNNNGKLLITKTTLENIVAGTVKEFPSIRNATSKVQFDKENNITINMVIDIEEGTIIKDLSSKLQTRVKKNIKDATNLDLNSVDIEIQNVEVKDEKTKDNDNKDKEGK